MTVSHAISKRCAPSRRVLPSVENANLLVDLVSSLFGKKIIDLGKNMETISRSRIEIDAMRLMVLKAARAMDVLGNKEARIWVSKAKAMVPEKCCKIIDDAMQVHGATGISQWSPLSAMYMKQRTLRFADGPDEVHHHVIARAERQAFEASNERQDAARSVTGTGQMFEGP